MVGSIGRMLPDLFLFHYDFKSVSAKIVNVLDVRVGFQPKVCFTKVTLALLLKQQSF